MGSGCPGFGGIVASKLERKNRREKVGQEDDDKWKVDVVDCQPSTQIQYLLVVSRTAFVACANLQHCYTVAAVTL